MPYDKDRDLSAKGQPSLEEMTAKAIELLSRNAEGFVLIVSKFESQGSISHFPKAPHPIPLFVIAGRGRKVRRVRIRSEWKEYT